MFRLLRRLTGQRPDAVMPTPCECCGRPTTYIVVVARADVAATESMFCGRCAGHGFRSLEQPTRAVCEEQTGDEFAVTVEAVVLIPSADSQCVVVRQINGPERLVFTTGLFEASGLSWRLKRNESPRPLTDAAWAACVTALGGTVDAVSIHTRHGDTFRAAVRLRQADRTMAVDVRPSDALQLALRTGAPAFVSFAVWADAALPDWEAVWQSVLALAASPPSPTR